MHVSRFGRVSLTDARQPPAAATLSGLSSSAERVATERCCEQAFDRALPLGIDPGTGAAALRLAGELGKQVTLYECPDGAWRAGQ